MSRTPLTKEGEILIKEKLNNLKFTQRPEISQAIAEARAHGDLKENAEYHAAKEEQSHNEGRITEISDIIARANVIDANSFQLHHLQGTELLPCDWVACLQPPQPPAYTHLRRTGWSGNKKLLKSEMIHFC